MISVPAHLDMCLKPSRITDARAFCDAIVGERFAGEPAASCARVTLRCQLTSLRVVQPSSTSEMPDPSVLLG
eukprot:5860269-Prymnesium_polylepis.2